MLFCTHLIIPWEQHDGQVSSLDSRMHQALDKTCLGLWLSFRSNAQPR